MPTSVDPLPSSEMSPWKAHSVTVALVALALVLFPLQIHSFGTIDFIQYWSAWKLLASGQNPYDSNLLYETQIALTSGESEPIFSWNPPWTYTLLAPFLAFPLSVGASLWCLFGFASVFFIATSASRALKVRDLGLTGATFAVLVFLQLWYSIGYGQLGVLFALSVTCFLVAVNAGRYGLAGLSLLPLTLKPHLFLLCAVPGILWLFQIPTAAAKRFLAGAIGGFTLLVAITLLMAPSVVAWWIEAMTRGPGSEGHFVHFQSWLTHTTASATRVLLFHTHGLYTTWPIVTIPVAAFALTSIYFWRRRPVIDWSLLLPPMLCLSLATSSYGWVYDQAPLVLCQYLLFARASECSNQLLKYGTFSALILLQVVPLLLITLFGLPAFYFFCVPWALLALLYISSKAPCAEQRALASNG